MHFAVLLLLVVHLAYARKHTLQYLYTSISGDDDEFTTIGLVDDSQFMYFDIDTMKASPRTEWMRQSETTDYWKSQTAVMIREHNWVRNNVPTKSTDMHTHQLVYGCEWNDETGKTNGFRKFAIDGEVFLYLDLKRMEWISPMQQGFNIQQKCNNKTISLAYWKDYLENECIENLKKFLQLGESSLEKTVSPQVSLLQRNASSPVLCHVTDFYPSNVTITWMKNGQEHYKDVKAGKLLPNEDGTFQKTVALKTEPDEWRRNEFSCVVEHQSRTIRKTLTEKEIRTNDEPSAPVGVTVAVVSVGILLLITAVIGYLLYQKKRKTGFVPAKSSDSGSDSSSQTAAQA